MESVVTITSAAVLTGYVVEFVKMAAPNVRPWISVLVAVVAGIMSALIIAVSTGATMDAASIATRIVEGVAAAATAAGLTRTVARAEQTKIDAMHVVDDDEGHH